MRRRIPSLPPLRRVLPLAACGLVLLVGIGFWVRDSSFFGVEKVIVVGASGPDAPEVESALRKAARDMTTLNLDREELLQAVEGYPTVRGVAVDRDLPNSLEITVLERRPVAVVTVAGRRVPLTADGRLLKGSSAPENLPSLAIKQTPTNRLSDDQGRKLLAVVAAAPSPLRHKARRAYLGRRGLTLAMQAGPSVYFGTTKQLAAKWAAAARVLADPTAEGARYVDVREPGRAAAGGLAPLARSEDPATEPPTDPATPQTTPPTEAQPST